MKKPSAEQYFNMDVHNCRHNRHPESCKPMVETIRKYRQNAARAATLFDVECGNGAFIKEALEIKVGVNSFW